jgi:hypothetical protein
MLSYLRPALMISRLRATGRAADCSAASAADSSDDSGTNRASLRVSGSSGRDCDASADCSVTGR